MGHLVRPCMRVGLLLGAVGLLLGSSTAIASAAELPPTGSTAIPSALPTADTHLGGTPEPTAEPTDPTTLPVDPTDVPTLTSSLQNDLDGTIDDLIDPTLDGTGDGGGDGGAGGAGGDGGAGGTGTGSGGTTSTNPSTGQRLDTSSTDPLGRPSSSLTSPLGASAKPAVISAFARALYLSGPLAAPLMLAMAAIGLLIASSRGSKRLVKAEHTTKMQQTYRL